MPIGTIDEVFAANIAALKESAADAAAAATNGGLRAWMLGDTSLWAGNPLDLDSIGEAFSRRGPGSAYALALVSSHGSTGDAMSAKFQSDALAARERAFRLRHATAVRCGMHAAGRRAGQAEGLGAAGRLETHAQDLIAAGAAGFRPRSSS